MGNVSGAHGAAYCSQWSDLAEIRTRPRFYALPASILKKDRMKNNRD